MPRKVAPRTKLAEIRQASRLTQEQLADVAGVGRATVQRLELGDMPNPRIRLITNLALALGVHPTELMEDEWLAWTANPDGWPAPPTAQEREEMYADRTGKLQEYLDQFR